MAKKRPTRLKVLFIGNSFTQRNNLPGMLARMAEATGAGMEWRLISVGGASLRTHWNKGEATRAIAEGEYDYVVLQEQSTLPIKNAARMHENVRLFDAAIKSAGAKTALYLTWARKSVPQKQADITNAYESIGKELNAKVVPAGLAWQRFLAGHDKPVLHDADQSHPTVAGTYLAACVFLQTLFAQSPAGNKAAIAGLSDEDRTQLQQAAMA
jgi:hypothetical protein